ncbi:PilZ domain-containing protein [Vibrio hepatarius]|uniref:PilZ domain-containing protein n=1 Tax=Vibrio hepatarius TaxID=171383 RepID=UPI00142DBF2A|nr:PilZ domain-containing protein [Vibrio hepatarius]NIY81649.1 PilZ domain-containing protein [Vibrio hepatarius]
MSERRRFSRIVYRTPAIVVQGELTINASISDLSLHGLLITCDQANKLNLDKQIDVEFALLGSDITIQLTGNIVEINNNMIRLSIDHIDIESIGYLKRLVELNVGDDELLYRDIEHLSELGEHT